MNRSGMKRGLALSAVTALAVTGMTVGLSGTAYAVGGVNLETQLSTSTGSVQADGTNETIHLVAQGPAAAAKMLFEYSTNGGFTYTAIDTVGPVAGVSGLFSAEWAPAASLYNTNVLVRSRAISSVDTPIIGAFDTNTVYVSTTDNAVNIDNAPGSALGVYQRPGSLLVNGIITGQTSDVVGGASVDVDSVLGTGGATAADHFGAVSGNSRPFSAVADFAGDPVGSGYALARAEDSSDDVEPVKLYAQTISSGTDWAVDRELIPVGETGTVTVTVRDQFGAPIAGAAVRRELPGPDGPVTLTDSRGQAVFPGLMPSPGGTQYRYYVDADVNGNYLEADEYARTFTLTSYVPTPTTITNISDNGSAFDEDEYGSGDVRAKLTDQHGNGYGPQQIQYQWQRTGAAALPVGTAFTDGFGSDKGEADIPKPASMSTDAGTWTLKTWIESNGNPGLNGDEIADTDAYKVGQAKVVWNDGNVSQFAIGTLKAEVGGTLQLADGTVLPGRDFGVTLGDVNGSAGENAVMAAQANQPAGATRAPIPFGDNLVIVETDGSGKFAVAVSDPAGAAANTLEDRIVTAAATFFGTYNPTQDHEVDFLDKTPAMLTQASDNPISIDGDTLTPGRPTRVGNIAVKNAAGFALTDVSVNVAVDHGYLTEYGTNADDLTPAVAKVAGGKIGDWKDLGASQDETTEDGNIGQVRTAAGNSGKVVNKLAAAISRDAGFDDNGQVTTSINASLGSLSDPEGVTWDSANPLNAESTTLSFSTDNVSRILPKAATYLSDGTDGIDRGVNLDLVTLDQFGNRTDDDTDLSEDSPTASLSGFSNDNGQFTGENPHVNAQSTPAASDQTVTSTWDARKATWEDNDPTPAVNLVATFGDTVKVGTKTINWYVVDAATSTFTMDHTGSSLNPVGSTITETYKAIDQNGQPMSWRKVDFFRAGPDTLQNGNPQQTTHSTRTNADGVATYVFQGTQPGNATLAGLLYDENDQPLEPSKADDKVAFGDTVITPGDTQLPIKVTLAASNATNGADILLVKTSTKAVGAKVHFYKFVAGKKVLLGTGKVRSNGYAKALIRDSKLKGMTYYSVTVDATTKTKGATSNTARTK